MRVFLPMPDKKCGMTHLNLKAALIILLAFFIPQVLFCGNEISSDVQKLIEKAFTKKTPEAVIAFISAEAEKSVRPAEKRQILIILADYEERFDFFKEAVNHYLIAAENAPLAEKKTLLLKAAGAAVLADDMNKAFELCNDLLLLVQTPMSEEDAKIILYSEWLKLKFYEEGSKEFSSAILSMKKHVTDSAFKEFHPALLLTLWWIENDKRAENTLLKKFPNSIEAGIVRGEAVLSPKTFWYLMPRSFAFTETEEESELLIGSIELQSAGSTQLNPQSAAFQVGFFKTEDYAKALLAELLKKGFKASIKEDRRVSGLFYSVFVFADGNGDVLLRLKQAGYEPVPVFR